jgi:hypothetical protein
VGNYFYGLKTAETLGLKPSEGGGYFLRQMSRRAKNAHTFIFSNKIHVEHIIIFQL